MKALILAAAILAALLGLVLRDKRRVVAGSGHWNGLTEEELWNEAGW